MRPLVIALPGGWIVGCSVVLSGTSVPDGEAVIYVVDQGWHTDIGLPVEEVKGPLAGLVHGFPGARFVVFGFGQRRYYMAAHPGSGDMLTALLPSDAALLVTALRVPPEQAFADRRIVLLHLPGGGVDRITDRLWDDLEKAPDGSAVQLAQGPTIDSDFYASKETYDAFHTCNTWAALLLREGGLPINSHVLLAGQVMRQVAWLASRQR